MRSAVYVVQQRHVEARLILDREPLQQDVQVVLVGQHLAEPTPKPASQVERNGDMEV